MPLWLQATLVAGFWLVFWPALAYWAHREGKRTQRARVQDLYPPRIHGARARR